MKNPSILISGAGIAGPALAYWLQQYGYTPVVVERAPALRKGGFAIDVRGPAVNVARKMGLLDRLRAESVDKGEIQFVDSRGRRVSGFNSSALHQVAPDSWVEIMRGDLVNILYDATRQQVEYIFGDVIQGILQHENGVEVAFRDHPPRSFDLVIGADGQHSVVRELAFGDEEAFARPLGYHVAVFSVDNRWGLTRQQSGYMYNMPGKLAAVLHYTNRSGGRTFGFLLFKSATGPVVAEEAQQQQLVREAFQNEGWELSWLLEQMSRADDFYFDAVSQIRMPAWSKGRVTLVGDAGYCPSLLTGQGTSVALTGAYILAGALKAAQGNYATAFRQYEQELRAFVAKEQKTGLSANLLAPDTRFGIWLRNRLAPFLLRLLLKVPAGVWRKVEQRSRFQIRDYQYY